MAGSFILVASPRAAHVAAPGSRQVSHREGNTGSEQFCGDFQYCETWPQGQTLAAYTTSVRRPLLLATYGPYRNLGLGRP